MNIQNLDLAISNAKAILQALENVKAPTSGGIVDPTAFLSREVRRASIGCEDATVAETVIAFLELPLEANVLLFDVRHEHVECTFELPRIATESEIETLLPNGDDESEEAENLYNEITSRKWVVVPVS